MRFIDHKVSMFVREKFKMHQNFPLLYFSEVCTMAEKIAVIGGTGDLGFGLALRWAMAGKHIIIGSRKEEKAKRAAKKIQEILGNNVKVEGKINYDAAAEADIIVLSVPFFAQIGILKNIKDALKPGKILVDVIVPLATAIDGPSTKTLGVWTGSAAKLTEQLVPKGVKVVAAFKNVPADAVQNLNDNVNCDVIVCGDDEEAKKKIMNLAEVIPGVRAVDGGSLENAHVVEELTAFLINVNMIYGVKNAGIRITGIK